MTEDERIEYDEIINYVETTEPDKVAEYIKQLKEQLAEGEKEIAELKNWCNWYKMWHTKFKKQIEELTTELETYRPTKLTGEGQTTCYCCKEISWTCFGFYHYKGQTLCDECLKKLLKDENKNSQIRHNVCEKIRKKFLEKCKNSFCSNPASVDYITLEISEVKEFLDEIVRGEE